MTQRPNSLQRAFTMIEIIMSLALLTIFFAAAGQVFHSSVMLSYDAPRLSNQASRIDSAVFQLRRDVWNSSRIAASPQSVDLSWPDGTTTAWKIDGGSLTRTDARGQTESRPAVGNDWSFSTDGVSLTISDGTAAPILLASQILLSERGHP